jgi:hypothetical protein
MPDTSPPARRLREALSRLAEQTLGRPPTGRSHEDADGIAGTMLTTTRHSGVAVGRPVRHGFHRAL